MGSRRRLRQRTGRHFLSSPTEQRGVVHVQFEASATVSSSSAVTLTCSSLIQRCLCFSAVGATAANIVGHNGLFDTSLSIGSCTTTVLFDLPCNGLAVLAPCFLDLLSIVLRLVFLIETLEEASLSASRYVSPTCALFLHSVHSVGDIESLFESTHTRRPAFAVARANGCQKRRVHRSAGHGYTRGWRRWRWGVFDPRVCKELVNGVTLSGVNAEEMGDEILGRVGDVIPPWAQEGVVSSSDLFGQDIDTFVVEC